MSGDAARGASSDPGLQPERTALAWMRTGLGYLANAALIVRAAWNQQDSMSLMLAAAVLVLSGWLAWTVAGHATVVAGGPHDGAAARLRAARLATAAALLCAVAAAIVIVRGGGSSGPMG